MHTKFDLHNQSGGGGAPSIGAFVIRTNVIFVLFSFLPNMRAGMLVHLKCRNAIYPQSNVNRFPVPDHLVPWRTKFDEYQPIFYESPTIQGKRWSDTDSSTYHFEDYCISGNEFVPSFVLQKTQTSRPNGTQMTGESIEHRFTEPTMSKTTCP